jgi:hypothetical protein
MIVYNSHARPLAILRVLHGKRDLKRLLKFWKSSSRASVLERQLLVLQFELLRTEIYDDDVLLVV